MVKKRKAQGRRLTDRLLDSLVTSIEDISFCLSQDYKIVWQNQSAKTLFRNIKSLVHTLDNIIHLPKNKKPVSEIISFQFNKIFTSEAYIYPLVPHSSFPAIVTIIPIVQANKKYYHFIVKNITLLNDYNSLKQQYKKEEKFILCGVLNIATIHSIASPLSLIYAFADRIRTNQLNLSSKGLPLFQHSIARIRQIMSNFHEAQDTRLRKFNLFTILYKCLEEMKHSHPDIKIIITGSRSLYYTGNKAYFYYLFENIISNACHAIKNTGLITITAKKEKSIIKIEFKDTGPGFPDDVLKWQKQGEIQVDDMGRGLGIMICQHIVSYYSGEIEFLNSASGATVKIAIPTNHKI